MKIRSVIKEAGASSTLSKTSLLLFLLSTVLLGCSDNNSSTDANSSITPVTNAITCPDDRSFGIDAIPLSVWDGAQCHLTTVPLTNLDPNSTRAIEVFSASFPANVDNGAPVKGTLVFLDGGPGGTGAGQSPNISMSHQSYIDAGWNLLIPSHRGTGNSAPLDCSNIEEIDFNFAELAACGRELGEQYGADLAYYSSIEAAYDVCHVVPLRASEELPVVLVGVSYGTYLAQQVLKVCQDRFDRIVLDGVLPIDTIVGEPTHNLVGNEILKRCTESQICRDKFGATPLPEFYDNVMDRISNAGHCAELRDENTSSEALNFAIKGAITSLISNSAALVPPLIYRLDRCGESDINLIKNIIAFHLNTDSPTQNESESGSIDDLTPEQLEQLNQLIAEQGLPVDDPLVGNPGELDYLADFNGALAIHIYIRELNNNSSNLYDNLYSLYANDRFAPLILPLVNREVVDAWPVQTANDLDKTRAATNKPLLIINSEWEMQTYEPWAASLAQSYQGPNQHYLKVQGGDHVITGVPAESDRTGVAACAQAVFLQFAETSELDTSCMAEINELLDWDNEAQLAAFAKEYFDTDNPWD